jgi:hypothetical protein
MTVSTPRHATGRPMALPKAPRQTLRTFQTRASLSAVLHEVAALAAGAEAEAQ